MATLSAAAVYRLRQAATTSAKNFWRLEACVAAPGRLIIFTSSHASFSAAWIFLCPPALFSPCTPPLVPSASSAALRRYFPYPSHVHISCLCPPVPAPRCSTTMLLHSFSLLNVHSKFRPSRSLGRTLSVLYYPYSTLPCPISSFCYSSLLFL